MQISKKPYPITTLNDIKSKIDPAPDYQRPPVWKLKQKQLLMDTILREYDIPKIYWKRIKSEDKIQFEVIDGQQRLRAIWEFCAGGFSLAKDMDAVDGIDCAGKKYDDLDIDLRSGFDLYSIDVVIVDDAIQNAKEDEVRDMFLRLQNGTTLNSQEKRNAITGSMHDFVKSLSKHRFFEHCKFKNTRFTFDHIAAQMVRLEIEGGPTGVSDTDLNRMYEEHKNFDLNCKTAKKVRHVLDYLEQAFPEKTPELGRSNTLILYFLVSTLIESYVFKGTESDLAQWFIDFERHRRADERLDEDDRDPYLAEYRRLTSHATDSEESIKSRLVFLEKRFFLALPNIQLKDDARSFTPEQCLAIYRKNEGRCQLQIRCQGKKRSWGQWHADHITAHSMGGKTTVANGQVACLACNAAKVDK